MSLMNFRAKNHPQQVAANGAREDTDDRRTPDELWLPLHEEFRFTVDAAATAENTKCAKWYRDAFAVCWSGERVWCNPPYSNLAAWAEKAWQEMALGCELVVLLAPANRTEQRWWQDNIEPYRDRPNGDLRVRFLRGRQRFDRPGWTKPAKGDRPPFGLCLLIWSAQ